MLGNANLVAFGATADPAASREFYEDVLGLSFVADEQAALVFETPSATLRISKVETVDPPDHTLLGWEVDGLEAAVEQLAAAGVEFARYDDLPQDDLGIASFPDGSSVAWFEDPDGNTLSVAERD